MTTLLEAALGYHARGWRPIALHRVGPDNVTCSCGRGGRCNSAGKHPKDNAWQNAPRLSVADIYATWDVERAPNLGIATGADSGIFVLDIDPDGGGMESMAALVAQRGALPETFVAQTGSGGFHYVFEMPDFEVRNSQSKIAKGIDIRGEGGQIVAPPSRSGKGVYTVIRDVDPLPAPAWLLEAVRPNENAAEIVTAEDLPKPDDIAPEEWVRLNGYAERAVAAEVGRLQNLQKAGWDGEPWNATTFQAACSMLEFANSPWCSYSTGQAKTDLFAHAPRDTEGFDDAEIEKIWRSATTRVADHARPMPPGRQKPSQDPLFADVPDATPKPGAQAQPVNMGRTGAPPMSFMGGPKGTTFLPTAAGDLVRAQGHLGRGPDGLFWVYDNGVWRHDKEVVARRATRILGDEQTPSRLSMVDNYLKFHPETRSIFADPHPAWMNFRNGMLDWSTGDMVSHDPDFLSTIQFPIDYNPEATCPTFDNFLGDIMHEDYVALAWEMLGYLMFSGNPMQVAFLLFGSGQNGKGTLIRVIRHILGDANVANESLDQLNGSTFSAVNLHGKIANLAGDIDGTYQESTANFKALTGEDSIGAERKYGDRFNFENWAVPVFSANKIPGSADVSEGYLRRWVVLHFHKKIPTERRVVGLSETLSMEVEGIAAKAIRALQGLMIRGRFEPQGEATKGIDEMAQAIDQVRQWAASGDAVVAPAAITDLATLYGSYSLWAGRTGRRPVNEVEFSHRLEAAGFPHKVGGHEGIKTNTAHAGSPSQGFF